MSLPATQQRMLHQIECALQASDPRLAAKFTIFTRLAADGPIGTERISTPRLRSRFRLRAGFRALTLIPVAIGLLITGIVLGGTAHGSSGCLRGWHSIPARGSAGCGAGMQPVRSVSPAPAPVQQSPQPSHAMRNMPDPG